MRLTVVLVNWRDPTQTIGCARALKLWQALQPTIAIVDNQSTEISFKELQEAGVAHQLLRSATNLGYGGGNNIGIGAVDRPADGAVLLLNSDAEISEGVAVQLLARLDADSDLSIVGPVLREIGQRGARAYAGGRDIARYPRTRVEVDPERLSSLPGYR